MNQITRRGFLRRLLGGVAALAVAPVIADPECELWVPGAKTIVLPPPGGWKQGVEFDEVFHPNCRCIRAELFTGPEGDYEVVPLYALNDPRTLYRLGEDVVRLRDIEVWHEIKQLYGANQYPVLLGRGRMHVEATFDEVRDVDPTKTPIVPLRYYSLSLIRVLR